MSLMVRYPWILRIFVYSVGFFFAVLVYAKLFFSLVWNQRKIVWRPKTREVPPACLTDPSRGTHCFAQLKDIKLHYVEKGDKTKPLMLFLHGFPEFWYSWRYQMDEFSKDFWTVAVDMRGYGDSDKPVGVRNYETNVLVNDVKEIVKFLGREKFTLVAHDWGGLVAWFFIYTYPEMLDRFIIMGSGEPFVFQKFILSNKRQFLKSWYIFFYQLPCLPEFFVRWNDMEIFKFILQGRKQKQQQFITDEDLEAFKYTFGKPSALTGPINYYRANVFNINKLSSQGSLSVEKTDICVPGLCLAGEKDLFIDSEILELTQKKHTSLITKTVKGANHFLQQDKPEVVNKIMSDFLQEK